MRQYWGTKAVHALMKVKDGKEGYKVVYEDGYESWSPKDAFEKVYRPNGSLTFGHALEALKAGKWITRSGWNGKNLYVKLVPGCKYDLFVGGTSIEKPYLVLIDHSVPKQSTSVPWVPSTGDCLAEDWSVVDPPLVNM